LVHISLPPKKRKREIVLHSSNQCSIIFKKPTAKGLFTSCCWISSKDQQPQTWFMHMHNHISTPSKLNQIWNTPLLWLCDYNPLVWSSRDMFRWLQKTIIYLYQSQKNTVLGFSVSEFRVHDLGAPNFPQTWGEEDILA
jgi:hypothetical protein